jgi:hypothetical protein
MPSRIEPVDELARGTARRSLALIVAALVLAAGAGLAADSHTRTVQGSVTAQDDTPVDGAVVYLKNTKTLQIRSFFTQKDGAYHFQDLSPDIDYELKAENHGTWSNPHTLSSFDTRKLATINLKLNPKK